MSKNAWPLRPPFDQQFPTTLSDVALSVGLVRENDENRDTFAARVLEIFFSQLCIEVDQETFARTLRTLVLPAHEVGEALERWDVEDVRAKYPLVSDYLILCRLLDFTDATLTLFDDKGRIWARCASPWFPLPLPDISYADKLNAQRSLEYNERITDTLHKVIVSPAPDMALKSGQSGLVPRRRFAAVVRGYG